MIRSVYKISGTTAALLMVVVAGTWAADQRGQGPKPRTTAPNGSEIAAAARGARLDTGNVATATMFGKPFKFTPAQLGTKADKPDDGKDGFLGVLENGAVGDETGLPPGKYNLYFANVNGQLKGYAEANGQVVKEAIRVTSTPAPDGAKGRPTFIEKGWSIRVPKCQATPGYLYCYWVTISY